MTHRLLLLVAMLAAALPSARARAELSVETESSPEGELTIFRMTVTPAAEPVPALAQRLVSREIDVKYGNAAPMYYRAIMQAPQITKALNDKFGEDWYEWVSASGDAFPVDKAREAAAIIGSLDQLREAAARRESDWAWRLDEITGPELYSYLLPEIQESRQLSRFLVLQARVAIAEQRYADALDLVRINFKMGQDVANEPILVCGLVGIAEVGMGHRALVDLIAAPGSPNLYWALTELPNPPISLRHATRFEMSSLLRVLPFLKDAETQEHSPEEWARLLAEGMNSMQGMTGDAAGFPNREVVQMGVAALAMTTYPPAKQRLIDGGMDAQRVEQMPVGQVIAVDAAREFRRMADELEKWWYVPYRVARERSSKAEQTVFRDKLSGGYGGMLAALLLPALNAARSAEARIEWQTDGLRVVEAVRMHAAKTGSLPASLDEIEVVPVPENPVTGKPFEYRLEGDTAKLELPFSDRVPSAAWRFEIKLAK
jgi:hypothetical protein